MKKILKKSLVPIFLFLCCASKIFAPGVHWDALEKNPAGELTNYRFSQYKEKKNDENWEVVELPKLVVSRPDLKNFDEVSKDLNSENLWVLNRELETSSDRPLFLSGLDSDLLNNLSLASAQKLGKVALQVSASSCINKGEDILGVLSKSSKPVVLIITGAGVYFAQDFGKADPSERGAIGAIKDFMQAVSSSYPYVQIFCVSEKSLNFSHQRDFRTVKVGLPSNDTRGRILRELFPNDSGSEDYQDALKFWVQITKGFSASQLREIKARVDGGEEIDTVILSMQKSVAESLGEKLGKNLGKVSLSSDFKDVDFQDYKFSLGADEATGDHIYMKLISFARGMKKFADEGAVDTPPALLLYGPPGTGKTEMVKSIAKMSGYNLINVRSSAIVTELQGSGAANMAKIFEVAEEITPCIIFFDEMDVIAKSLKGSSDSADLNAARVSLQVKMLDDHKGLPIAYLGATNYKSGLEKALSDRFQPRFSISFPPPTARLSIIVNTIITNLIKRELLNSNSNDQIDHCYYLLTTLFVPSQAVIQHMRKEESANITDSQGNDKEVKFLTGLSGRTLSSLTRSFLKEDGALELIKRHLNLSDAGDLSDDEIDSINDMLLAAAETQGCMRFDKNDNGQLLEDTDKLKAWETRNRDGLTSESEKKEYDRLKDGFSMFSAWRPAPKAGGQETKIDRVIVNVNGRMHHLGDKGSPGHTNDLERIIGFVVRDPAFSEVEFQRFVENLFTDENVKRLKNRTSQSAVIANWYFEQVGSFLNSVGKKGSQAPASQGLTRDLKGKGRLVSKYGSGTSLYPSPSSGTFVSPGGAAGPSGSGSDPVGPMMAPAASQYARPQSSANPRAGSFSSVKWL